MKYIKLFEETLVHGIEIPFLAPVDKENNFSWEDIQHYLQDFIDDGWTVKPLEKKRIYGICESDEDSYVFSKISGYKIEIYITREVDLKEGGSKFVVAPNNVDYAYSFDFEDEVQRITDLYSRIEESKGRFENDGFKVWVRKVGQSYYGDDKRAGVCFNIAKYTKIK